MGILGDGKALGLILFHNRPTATNLTLQSYIPELDRFTVQFEAQGEVKIQAVHGCCIKGVFSYAGTPFEDLFEKHYLEAAVGPDQIPRGDTPA